MSEGPYALALAAGAVAAVNPCGFALLPAYLALVVGRADGADPLRAVARALRMTGAMTAGFVGVFGAFAAVVVPLALSLERYLPWATVAIGVALVVLGGWLLTGRELLLRLPRTAGVAPDGSVRSMVLYGATYAVASLSCTVGPFLAVAAATARADGLPQGVAVVLSYALGMGAVVGVLAVATALAGQAAAARVRRVLPYVGRASGALLVVAGLYVAHYGWYEVRVLGGGSTEDPVVDAALAVQGRLASWVDAVGVLVPLLVVGALLLVLAVRGRRRTPSRR